jgi:streptogramin lyase
VSQDDARHLVEAAVWSDSRGGLWITGSNSGDLFRYDSKNDSWKRWHLPGDSQQPYTVYVDDTDGVWVSDWGANAILRFDPKNREVQILSSTRQLRQRTAARWSQRRGLGSRIRGRQALRDQK